MRAGITVGFLCLPSDDDDLMMAASLLSTATVTGLIGFIAFFAISSLVSDTNLWPMLGNLLTMLWVIDADDGAGDDDGDDMGKLPRAVSSERRADNVDTYGVWLAVCSLDPSSSNFGILGKPSVIFFTLRGTSDVDETLLRFNRDSF